VLLVSRWVVAVGRCCGRGWERHGGSVGGAVGGSDARGRWLRVDGEGGWCGRGCGEVVGAGWWEPLAGTVVGVLWVVGG
jgi:hypothetical protein